MRDIESKKEMVNYIENCLARGMTIEDVYQTLLTQGYLKSMVNVAYEEVQRKSRARKEVEAARMAEQARNTQKVEVIAEPPKKKSFFGKLFG